MSTLHRCYIGMGSNLGDSQQLLTDAVMQLKQLGDVAVSRLYLSPPMGPQDQPHYYNAVVRLDTNYAPLALLDALQAIEQQAGRERLRRWGERTLDLDILLYDFTTFDHPRLTVPHVGMLERDFVLLPLLDVATDDVIQHYQVKIQTCLDNATAKAISDQNWLL